MNDLDRILSMVENPTRRRILQAIVREPHYPLQLSKELGISQQSVVKNLEAMEKNGLVVRYKEHNTSGPDRIFYRPNSEFTIVIDMRNGMFDTRIVSPNNEERESNVKENVEDTKEFQETRKMISEVDRQLSELNLIRLNLIDERNRLIKEYLDGVDGESVDYEHRNLLYEMLNNPDKDIESISKAMGRNESSLDRMFEELMKLV
jgi:ArsR family transcriptional regulator